MGRKKARLYLRGTTWWCWFYDWRGRRISQSTHQRDKALAREAAKRAERRHNLAPETEAFSLMDAIAQFMDSRDRKGCAPDTLAFYQKLTLRLPDRLLQRDVNALRLGDIEQHQDERLKTVGKHTVAKEVSFILSVMRYAERRGQFVGKVETLKPDGLENAYKPGERSLSRAEFQRLMAKLSPDRRDYLMAFVALGVRDGELYRITAAHVDIKAGMIAIPGTKTEGAARQVPIQEQLLPVLKRRMAAHKAGPLFPRWGNVRRDLHRGCELAGIPGVSPNDLRRTFATWLSAAGEHESTVARFMGHSSSAMVRRVYQKAGPEVMRRAIRRLRLPVAAGVAETKANRGHRGRGKQ